jgi:hypothetical protein
MQAVRRLMREFRDLTERPTEGILAGPIDIENYLEVRPLPPACAVVPAAAVGDVLTCRGCSRGVLCDAMRRSGSASSWVRRTLHTRAASSAVCLTSLATIPSARYRRLRASWCCRLRLSSGTVPRCAALRRAAAEADVHVNDLASEHLRPRLGEQRLGDRMCAHRC